MTGVDQDDEKSALEFYLENALPSPSPPSHISPTRTSCPPTSAWTCSLESSSTPSSEQEGLKLSTKCCSGLLSWVSTSVYYILIWRDISSVVDTTTTLWSITTLGYTHSVLSLTDMVDAARTTGMVLQGLREADREEVTAQSDGRHIGWTLCRQPSPRTPWKSTPPMSGWSSTGWACNIWTKERDRLNPAVRRVKEVAMSGEQERMVGARAS